MFTHSCHINKNTKYIIDKLNILGRKFVPNGFAKWYIPIEDCKYLYCSDEPFNGNRIYYYTGKMVKPSNSIWCGTNEELFLAIAALRDDSDIHQWFVHDDSDWNDDPNIFWYKCESESINDDMAFNLMCNDCRKATVEELIKHFTA